MRLSYHLYALMLSLLVPREFFPITLKVKLIGVLDGDTVKIQYFGHITPLRLAFIDAPELGQKTFLQNKDAGMLATRCLQRILSHHPLTLLAHGRDTYQRLIGSLQTPDYDVQLEMLERGCASILPLSLAKCPQCFRARERAQRKRVGLWTYGGFMRPMVYRREQKKSRSRGAAYILGRN
jgi:endonuclease YncB( thermonuclease family)